MSDKTINPMIKHMAYNKFLDRTLTHVYKKIREEHNIDIEPQQKEFLEDHSDILVNMCMKVFEKYENVGLGDFERMIKYLNELVILIMDLVAINGVNAALAAYYEDMYNRSKHD